MFFEIAKGSLNLGAHVQQQESVRWAHRVPIAAEEAEPELQQTSSSVAGAPAAAGES